MRKIWLPDVHFSRKLRERFPSWLKRLGWDITSQSVFFMCEKACSLDWISFEPPSRIPNLLIMTLYHQYRSTFLWLISPRKLSSRHRALSYWGYQLFLGLHDRWSESVWKTHLWSRKILRQSKKRGGTYDLRRHESLFLMLYLWSNIHSKYNWQHVWVCSGHWSINVVSHRNPKSLQQTTTFVNVYPSITPVST